MSDAGNVDPKAGVRAVFGQIAPVYDTIIPFFATFVRQLVDAAQLEHGQRVLDLCCGRGVAFESIVAAIGAEGHLTAIHLAAPMVEEAATHATSLELDNVLVKVGDAEALPFEEAVFDVVLCGFGVFFFPDPATALREVRRVLRPGGRFAATTFTDGVANYPWLSQILKDLGRDQPLPRTPALTAEGLRGLLVDAGFGAPATSRVEGRFLFKDVDDLIAWNWSTGGRRIMASLSDDEMATYRERAAAEMAAHHAVDGGFEFVQSVDITVAPAP